MLPCNNCLENSWNLKFDKDWVTANCKFCNFEKSFPKKLRQQQSSFSNCKKCGKQVILVPRNPNKKKKKNQTYFYTHYYRCTGCSVIFLSDKFRVAEESIKNKNQNLTEIHTDASFATRQYTDGVQEDGSPMYGTLCMFHKKPILYQVEVLKVASHLQYNSVFEFMAVQKAMEYAINQNIKKLLIVTDSTNCKCWFKKMKPKGKTIYHLETFKKIQELKKSFSYIGIIWKPREENKAGIYLENMGYE